MLCRLLLAVFIVTCTCFRDAYTETTTQLKLKDLICVLVLSGIQKEDLDQNTLEKLQRHNVNTDRVFKNEQVKQDCIRHHLLNAVNISHYVYMNNTVSTPRHARNHSGTKTIPPKTKSDDAHTAGDMVMFKLFVLKNGTNWPEQEKERLRHDLQLRLKDDPNEEKNQRKSIFRYNLRELNNSIIPAIIEENKISTTTEVTEEMIPENLIETTQDKTEKFEVTTTTIVTTIDKSYSSKQIAEHNTVAPHTKLGINEKDKHKDNNSPINLESYIKEQIHKYLSTEKTNSNKIDGHVTKDLDNSTCNNPEICKTIINDHINAKLQLMKDLTTKTVSDVTQLSEGQLTLNMNLLNQLAKTIKNVILNDIREELQATTQNREPLMSTTPGIINSSLSTIIASTRENITEKLPLSKDQEDTISKLMELIEKIRQPRLSTSQQTTTAADMPLKNKYDYNFKSVYAVYNNPQQQNQGNQPVATKPPNSEYKEIHTKPPYPIPELTYVEHYEHFKTPDRSPTKQMPHEPLTLPVIMPKVVLDTKIHLETVNLKYDYNKHRYEDAKELPFGAPSQGSAAVKHKGYNEGKIQTYELTKPEKFFNAPMQFQQVYVTSKPAAEPYQMPKPQEYVYPPKTPVYAHSKLQNVPQQTYHAPAPLLNPRQFNHGQAKIFEYSNIHQNPLFLNQNQKGTDPTLMPKHYWLPPVVSYNNLNQTIKHTPVTKIQTNKEEIPPLRVISSGHPVYQNIIVPKSSAENRPNWNIRPRNVLPKALASQNIAAEQWNRIRHQMQSNIEDMKTHENSLSPQLDDIWHYNQNHYGNAAKYHVQLEHNNQEAMPAPGPHHHNNPKPPAQTEHTRVASRQQMPYAHNHIFADKHIKKLMKSQQRISDILERVLSLNKMIDDTSSQFLT